MLLRCMGAHAVRRRHQLCPNSPGVILQRLDLKTDCLKVAQLGSPISKASSNTANKCVLPFLSNDGSFLGWILLGPSRPRIHQLACIANNATVRAGGDRPGVANGRPDRLVSVWPSMSIGSTKVWPRSSRQSSLKGAVAELDDSSY